MSFRWFDEFCFTGSIAERGLETDPESNRALGYWNALLIQMFMRERA